MKYSLLLLFLFPVLTQAQECKLTRSMDPYTKLQTISTGFIPFEGGALTIDANKTDIDLLFSVAGADKCFSDNSTVVLFFEGGKQKQLQRNNGTMNCEGLFHVIFRNGKTTPGQLTRLSTKKVEKIVFTGNNKTVTTITLTPEQQQMVLDLVGCIIKEAPALVQ